MFNKDLLALLLQTHDGSFKHWVQFKFLKHTSCLVISWMILSISTGIPISSSLSTGS